jgi:hypothetical protein
MLGKQRRIRSRSPYLTLTNTTDRFGCYLRGNGTLTADWDDGTTTTLTLSGSSQILSHIWSAGAASRTIKITGDITFLQGDESAPLGGANSFRAYGDLSHLPNLNYINLAGDCHFGGLVQEWPDITNITAMGSSNLCGLAQPWPKINNIAFWSNTTVCGSAQAWPNLTALSIGGTTAIGGIIQAWPLLNCLTIAAAACNIGGTLKNWPNLWKGVFIGGNTVSGDMSALTGVQYWYEGGNSNITHPASWLAFESLCYVQLKGATSACVDNLINCMDTNKGKTKPLADRTIICTNGCGAPTSASSTAKANLIAAGWSVTTN